MWSDLAYVSPLMAILSRYSLKEEFKMEGNLADELEKLFKKHLKSPIIRFAKKPIHANIHATYPIGTNLWTIVDTIITMFHLIVYIDEKPGGIIVFELKEGCSWKR